MNLLFIYFRASWKAHVVLAALFFGAAIYTLQSVRQTEVERAAALAAPQPVAVSLNAFTDADIHLADEVHVTGQINTAYNYELTQQRKGTDTVRRMFVLFGPDDAEDATVARAAVILDPADVDAFIAMMTAQMTGASDYSLIFTLNGAADASPDLHTMAIEAMADEKLNRAPDFVFIEPWLDGRAAALAPHPEEALVLPAIVAGPGLLSVLLALFGFRRSRSTAAAATRMAAAPIPAALMGHPVTATAFTAAPAPTPAPAPQPKAPISVRQKVALAWGILLVASITGVPLAPFGLVLLTVAILNRQVREPLLILAREAMALIRNFRGGTSGPIPAVLSPAATSAAATPASAPPPAASFTPARPKPQAKPLPPAIRPGFSFRDLLPKRREPEPQENPYASLAASIRDERLRRSSP